MIRLSDFVLPKLKQIEFNDNEYDNPAVITFVSQGLETEVTYGRCAHKRE
jgi:hypothetical protein